MKTRRVLLWALLFLRETKTLHKEEIRKILFLRHDRIGDMVLSTAALKALRRTYPKAKITVLASKRNHEVLNHNPCVDEILIYNGILWFIREIRHRGYDLVIDPFLTYELRQAFMTCLAGGRYRLGFENAGREIFFNTRGPAASPPKRMVDHLLDLVELVGGRREGCGPEVFLSDAEITWATKTLAAKGISAEALTIAMHPGAYYPSQRWPVESFGELARRILDQFQAKVILLGSQEEKVLLHEVRDVAGKGVQVFPSLKLRELMALISKCDLLVCNNSGPLHIASAIKVPTVSMVGPTVIPLWLPYGKHNSVIVKELPCSPCNRANCKDHQCMESITVDEVFEAVSAHIRQKQKIKRRSRAKGRN